MRLITSLIITGISLLLSGCEIETFCGTAKPGDCFDDDDDGPVVQVDPEELRADLLRLAAKLSTNSRVQELRPAPVELENDSETRAMPNENDSPTTTNESTDSGDVSPRRFLPLKKRDASAFIPVDFSGAESQERQGVYRQERVAYSFSPETISGASLLEREIMKLRGRLNSHEGTVIIRPDPDTDDSGSDDVENASNNTDIGNEAQFLLEMDGK